MSEPQAYWNRIGTQLGRGDAPLWRQYSDAVNTRLLDRWLPTERVPRLLKTDLFDEAYSDGLVPVLHRHAHIVFGVDIARSTAGAAYNRAPGLRLAVSDVRQLPFPDDSVDVVVSNSTLDHFDEVSSLHRALVEICRVLRPGGRLVITLDNPWHPILALRSRVPVAWLLRAGFVPYEMGETLGPGAMRAALCAAGFEVTDASAVMHFPRVLVAQIGRLFAAHRRPKVERRLLSFLMAWEPLGRWPSRYLTGHFVAALAVKPTGRSPVSA
jgi:SAM-dependent methyltransferase